MEKQLFNWNNGFRYVTSGSLYNILRACQPHDYTTAGTFHHDYLILRMVGLYPHQAANMTWREVNKMVINKFSKKGI